MNRPPPTKTKLSVSLLLGSLVACTASSSPSDDSSSDTGTGGSSNISLGDAEKLYIAAAETLSESVDSANCKLLTSLLDDFDSYYPAMTNETYKSYASTRFKPVLDFMSRKACNEFGIAGDAESYIADAVAASPAGEYLSGTPLLEAIVDESSDLDALLLTANQEREAEGLDPIIVADYPNSIVGGPTSTIVFFPGWPDRPDLDQWLQVQRTLEQMFFISLEPRDDGSYASFVHSRSMSTSSGKTTIGTTFKNSTCLQCHYSGKPIHMRALDDADEAAKVATLVDYLQDYPAATNHPDYNPFPSSPGIGTGGDLTLEEASAYAGRPLTTTELATLNKNTKCDSCHNDSNQNALRPPLDEAVEILMKNGIMPPNTGVVDESERTEALNVMMAAYKVKLKSYFEGN